MRWFYYENITIQFRDIEEAWGIRQCNCLCSKECTGQPIFKCYDKHNYYAYCRVSCPMYHKDKATRTSDKIMLVESWNMHLKLITILYFHIIHILLSIFLWIWVTNGLPEIFDKVSRRISNTVHAVTVCAKETYDFTVMIVLACQWLRLTSHFQSTRFGKWLSQWASGMMHYGKDKSSAKIMPSVPLTRKESLG